MKKVAKKKKKAVKKKTAKKTVKKKIVKKVNSKKKTIKKIKKKVQNDKIDNPPKCAHCGRKITLVKDCVSYYNPETRGKNYYHFNCQFHAI